MAFHEEPIRLKMSPPSATHVQTFMAARDGELSDTQPPPPNREEEPQLSPSDPHLGGRTHINYRGALGTLQIMSCGSSLRELNTPPGTHQWALKEIQWDTGSPVRMTRRSPF